MRVFLTKFLLVLAFAAGLSAHASAQSGIVRTLQLDGGFDPAAAGAIDPSDADLAANLWRGADRADMARLIAGLPARLQSATLADLARRTLAVAAKPPEGAKTALQGSLKPAQKRCWQLVRRTLRPACSPAFQNPAAARRRMNCC